MARFQQALYGVLDTQLIMAEWMGGKEKNGLLQNVVQTTMSAFARIWLGEEALNYLTVGLAMNVVFAVCGEDNTRTGGDERGKSVGARVAFVPGGRSEGGLLAGANLDSMWRPTKGRDWFVQPLKRGMKSGERKARKKHKLGAFLIHSDNQSQWRVVYAPFFTAPTEEVGPLPAQFVGDSKELLRAYTCCFVHWLREKGVGKTGKVSHQAFAELLHAIHADPKSLEASCQKIYGVAPSKAGLDEDSLERRFLEKLQPAFRARHCRSLRPGSGSSSGSIGKCIRRKRDSRGLMVPASDLRCSIWPPSHRGSGSCAWCV